MQTVLSSNVTIEDIVAHVETIKIDPACQTFESEITSKDWKTKNTINADVYYRSIGVGYLTAMSAAYLNPSIKFDSMFLIFVPSINSLFKSRVRN